MEVLKAFFNIEWSSSMCSEYSLNKWIVKTYKTTEPKSMLRIAKKEFSVLHYQVL